MGLSAYQILEVIESRTQGDGKTKSLVITKGGKYLRGAITEHNVRVSSDGKVRGRVVMQIDGATKEVESGDIASIEAMA